MTHLARLTALTGVSLADLGGLSESQLAAVGGVATEEAQLRSWSQDTELLASILQELRRIANRLDAGIATVWAKSLKAPHVSPPIPRPDWVKDVAPAPAAGVPDAAASKHGEKVVSPREFFAMFRRR